MAPLERSAFRNAAQGDLAERFQSQLAQEMMISQRLRTSILSALFAIAAVFLFAMAGLAYFKQNSPTSAAPAVVNALALSMAVYEFMMRQFIDRRIRWRSVVPKRTWYLNALIEVSILTLVIVLVRDNFENPVHSLSIPAVLAYFLFIILSILYLDFKLSLFTGLVAAIEYLAVSLYTLSSMSIDSFTDPLFMAPILYIAKALLLLLGGGGAALVAAEFYRRMMSSFHAVEERNRERQANEFKTRFLANMSHEIRTPLNAVLGYAQLLESDETLTPQQRQSIRTIDASGSHLLGIINDVMDLSKIETGHEELRITIFDLRVLVQELATMFELQCSRKGVDWQVVVDPSAGEVAGDEVKLRQVLTNLLGNAAKFTETGTVAFRVTALPDSRYNFEIADTGPGIPIERQESIFEPFQQEASGRNKGGTGLGLAIAYRYVGLMGGHLQVSSMPLAGARFSFAVPLTSVSTEKTVADTESWHRVSRLAPDCSVHALVVDDAAENRDILARILQRVGVDVRQATSGRHALDQLTDGMPDIVFLDIRMPDLSGQETMDRMVEAHGRAGMKFVAVSASALAHERSGYLHAGFDAFIDKPVRMARVYACLSELLGVEYIFGPEPEAATHGTSGPAGVVLPAPLYESLRDAVLGHNVTMLRRHLVEMETLGEAESRLAGYLRELSRKYDMKPVLAALDEISHE